MPVKTSGRTHDRKVLIPGRVSEDSHIHINSFLKEQNKYFFFTPFLYYLFIFVILICFYVSSYNGTPVYGVSINIPDAEGASENLLDRSHLITVTSSGEIYYNDISVNGIEKLRETLLKRIASVPETEDSDKLTLLFRCDRNTPSSTLVPLVSMAHQLNANVFFLTNVPKEKVTNYNDYSMRE